MSGGNIQSATRYSAACLEAARYCLTADGSVYAASILPNQPNTTTNYQFWIGSSFAAPQVSGAVALLAQAFPSLTAPELRARILASADNSFFVHAGFVRFTSIVEHGFNSEFGHGFLDIAAALLPIGGSYIPASAGGTVSIEEPLIVSHGASGNAIIARLAAQEFSYTDGFGARFSAQADVLAASGLPARDPVSFLNERLWQGDIELAALGTGFADYLPGDQHSINYGVGKLSFLTPIDSRANNFGVDYQSRAASGLYFGFTALIEDGGFVGNTLTSPNTDTRAAHAGVNLGWSAAIAPGLSLALGARAGVALPVSGAGDVIGFGPTGYDELGLQLLASNWSARGDRFSFSLRLPQAVNSGAAAIMLPVTTNSGAPVLRQLDISMVPDARQVDLSADYVLPVGSGRDVIYSAEYSLNFGHVAGQSDTNLGVGWRMQF